MATHLTNYRELRVWQLGMELTKDVYGLSRGFPKEEVYGLTSQMRRAAVSIPANIAEGHARESTRDYLRFLAIARGSLAELETHLLLAQSLGYCRQEQTDGLLMKCEEEGRMLGGLQRRLKQKLSP